MIWPPDRTVRSLCPTYGRCARHPVLTGFRYSILYKTKHPFILVFNKTDVQPHDFAIEWMQDFEAFQAALASHQGTTDDEGEPTYMNSLMNSMSLVLDEFYKHLKAVSVSSYTGDGMGDFFEAVEASREEYEK